MRRWLYRLAWPLFGCEDCIGMGEYGCYCSDKDCEAPCTPPKFWRRWLRHAWLRGWINL